MSTPHVQLVDQNRVMLADAHVVDEGGYFEGTINLRATPAHIRALFEEFEEIVNGQMFVFLDGIRERIGSLPIKVVFDDGFEVSVKDLQVFPSTGDFSFRLAGVFSPTA